MTDTSALIPNSVAVSSDSLFTLKSSSVRARSYRASVPSSNKSTFVGGDVAIFYIPGGRKNTYLDPQQSYIRYTVQYPSTTATDSLYIDHVGSSFINRLDIFHASNLLETVQAYNVLYSYLVDFQFTQSAKQGLSAMYGCGNGTNSMRKGLPLYGNATAANAQRLTFCMPLLSGTVGLGADKFVPIGALSDDIRLELTWEANDVAACYIAGTTAWTILNAELELQIVELSDEGQSMVESVTPFSQPVFLHGNSWRHYVSTQQATAGQFSYLVPARFASLKTLVCLPRRSTEVTSRTSYSISSRANPNIDTYFWRVGAYIIPNKYVTLKNSNNTGGYAEAFAEVVKSFHSLNAPQYAAGIPIDYYMSADAADTNVGGGSSSTSGGVYAVGSYTTSTSYQNAFAIAQELESFANRSDILISGMNTLSSQVFFEGSIGTAPSNTYVLDFYANYDQIIVIENGIMSARF